MRAQKQSTDSLIPFRCTRDLLQGKQLKKILPHARALFRDFERKTKRRPHVRSTYFSNEKIFFDYFWSDLKKKIPSERARRLKLLPCAFELLQKTRQEPLTIDDITDPHMLLHRFAGITPQGSIFYVQVKQNKRTGAKQFLSVFPARRK